MDRIDKIFYITFILFIVCLMSYLLADSSTGQDTKTLCSNGHGQYIVNTVCISKCDGIFGSINEACNYRIKQKGGAP